MDHLRIAQVRGIPIHLHVSWAIIFGLIVWSLATGYFPSQYPNLPPSSHWVKGLVASVFFFLSILLHELGHALVGLRYGLRTRSITLFIFGGVAQLENDPPDARVEVRMAAAGPAVSIGLSGLFYLVAMTSLFGPSVAAVARYLALINLVLALFNLVPAFPLDGGRLLRGLLWGSLGKTRATQVAGTAGAAFALLLIFLGVWQLLRGDGITGVWYILIGWFLKDASTASYKTARLDEVFRGVLVQDGMIRDVVTVPADISVAEAARERFLGTGYSSYPVTRGDRVVGLLCLKDILALSPEARESTSVQGVMRPLSDGIVTEPRQPILNAMRKMGESGLGRLLVMDADRCVGLLTMGAVIRLARVREALGVEGHSGTSRF